MTKPSFRAPLTQAGDVLCLHYPFVRFIRQRQRRPSLRLQRAWAMEKRLCRPIFRQSSTMFWLALEYRHSCLPAWSRIRIKLLDVGRLTGRRAFRPDKQHAPFRGRFASWAEKSHSICREMGHDWVEVGDDSGSWVCAQCKKETMWRSRPPLHVFLTPLPNALGIERYLEWCRKSQPLMRICCPPDLALHEHMCSFGVNAISSFFTRSFCTEMDGPAS